MSRFYGVIPTPSQQWNMNVVNNKCEELEKILEKMPDSREKSIALTKLEEFAMWTNKAICHNKEYRDPSSDEGFTIE